MTKELLIMRHAKSSWENESLSDHDRPLNDRGKRDAPRMAAFLNDKELVPDLVVTSSANRARTTADILCQTFEEAGLEPQVVEDFYLAAPSTYIETLARLDDRYSQPLVVGHNPGLEGLVQTLTGESEFMSTAAIAHVVLRIDVWSEIEDGSRRHILNSVYRPKEVL